MGTEQSKAPGNQADAPGHHRFARFFDQSMDGHGEGPRIPKLWAHILGGIVMFLCRVLFRFKVENRRIPDAFCGKRNGAVIVAPHVSYLDVAIMWLAVRPTQYVRLMARDTLFGVAHGILGFFIARVGAFPVTRNTADRTAVKRASRMLKNGELVGVFPEGTRRGKGNKTPEILGGAALVARMGKAPIIPLGLVNLDKVKQKGKHVSFPRITAVFGEPVSTDAFDFLPKDERLQGCMWYMLRESFALSRGCTPEEVDMVALFPESKDYAEEFAGRTIRRVDVASLPEWKSGGCSSKVRNAGVASPAPDVDAARVHSSDDQARSNADRTQGGR